MTLKGINHAEVSFRAEMQKLQEKLREKVWQKLPQAAQQKELNEKEPVLAKLVHATDRNFDAAKLAVTSAFDNVRAFHLGAGLQQPQLAQVMLDAQRSSDVGLKAAALEMLARGRGESALDTHRVALLEALLRGATAADIAQLRATYIEKYKRDPELDILSQGLAQPLAKLSPAVEAQMLRVLNAAPMREAATALLGLYDKAKAATGSGGASARLDAADRAAYFAMLPMLGLWAPPKRAQPGQEELDATERLNLKAALKELRSDVKLDQVLEAIEGKLPAANIDFRGIPRERRIAVIASSHGAQWQELMDWAVEMSKKSPPYFLQIFTPDGRPVGIQRDSLSVSEGTSKLGYGAPPLLDPAPDKAAGILGRKLLANAAPASMFDAKAFGAVYGAGGLGFNEDVAVATPRREGAVDAVYKATGSVPVSIQLNENIRRMLDDAISERLPMVTLCHGATMFADTWVTVKDKEGVRKEPLNKGIPTASLPPAEWYVEKREGKGPQFFVNVNTHKVLQESGGLVDGVTTAARDAKLIDEPVWARRVLERNADGTEKVGIDIVSGPAPQAAARLAEPTVEVLHKRWGS